MNDIEKEEIEAFKKSVNKIMSRLGKAMENETGIRFTSEEIQTLRLTDIGESAAMFLFWSKEDKE